jgi:Lon protease-like protein
MDDDDLRGFANVCRLFPLPGVVLFPHTVVPLHIFEPRYREMTRDALADDQLVTVVQLHPPMSPAAGTIGSPPVEGVGCLGKILGHERLADGRYNFLLLGRKRVRLRREIPAGKPYRVAEVEIIEDVEEPDPTGTIREEIMSLFRLAMERRETLDPELLATLNRQLSLGALTDVVSHALTLPGELKQLLLADPLVARRAECLQSILRGMTPQDVKAATTFPPPFSAN